MTQLDEVVASKDYLVLVVNVVRPSLTTVEVIPGPVATIPKLSTGEPVVVGTITQPLTTDGADHEFLVLNGPSSGQALVNNLTAPVATVVTTASEQTLFTATGQKGDRGDKGDQGPAGTSSVYVQDTAPISPPAKYAWIQTNFPTAGNWTMWVNF